MSGNIAIAQKPRSFRMWRTLAALMLREMSTTYGRTSFGYVWAILEPVAGLMLLTMVFSLALRSPGLGTNFPLYYATGLLPFMAYMDISGKIAGAIRFSRPLLSFPAVTYIDALLARLLLNTLTQALVVGFLLSAIVVAYGLDVTINYLEVLLAMVMAISLAFGVGVMNCYLFYQSPMWERLWAIITRPLFFLSCIFYLFETVPEPYSIYLWFNPLVHVTGQFRRGVFPQYVGEHVSVAYVMGIALITTVLGLLLLHRTHRDILNN